MNRDQTKQLMAVIHAAYPSYYRGTSAQGLSDAVDLWTAMFAEEPPELVAGAVKAFIASDEKGFPPVIGQIKAKIRDLTAKEQLTETAAWALVRKAIANGAYGAVEEYQKLPDEIKSCVTPDLIREWAMDESGSEQVIASNFMRSYRVAVARKQELDALPADVRKLVDSKKIELPSNKETDS